MVEKDLSNFPKFIRDDSALHWDENRMPPNRDIPIEYYEAPTKFKHHEFDLQEQLDDFKVLTLIENRLQELEFHSFEDEGELHEYLSGSIRFMLAGIERKPDDREFGFDDDTAQYYIELLVGYLADFHIPPEELVSKSVEFLAEVKRRAQAKINHLNQLKFGNN